jgi:quinoprotein glucose dehydrogenase
VGARLTREQLLEALVDPSARIAPGFGGPPSAMPPMGALLSRRELRDLVEYLSTLRQPPARGTPLTSGRE